jgi:hypothetical protein
MAADTLCISFRAEGIHIIAKDHVQVSETVQIVDGTKINHYFCGEESTVYVRPGSMEKVIRILDNSYGTIMILLERATARNKMKIVYKNDLHIDEVREINFAHQTPIEYAAAFDDTDYPIKFSLPSKYFKKLITDLNSESAKTWTITKPGAADLTFTYENKDKSVSGMYVAKCPSLIELRSTVAADDIFSASVFVEHIRALSGALLSDKIFISADTHLNMIFRIVVDRGAVQVNMSTAIHKATDAAA